MKARNTPARAAYTTALAQSGPARDLGPLWRDPTSAPLNSLVRVLLRDLSGHEYEPPFDCIRTSDGWVGSIARRRLTVEVVGWRTGHGVKWNKRSGFA